MVSSFRILLSFHLPEIFYVVFCPRLVIFKDPLNFGLAFLIVGVDCLLEHIDAFEMGGVNAFKLVDVVFQHVVICIVILVDYH